MFFENFVTIEASLKQKGKMLKSVLAYADVSDNCHKHSLRIDLHVGILVLFHFSPRRACRHPAAHAVG